MSKPNIEVDWYRVPLPPETLKALNERNDLKGALQTIGYLAVVSTTGIASFYTWFQGYWLGFVLCLFLHGMVSAFYINGVHELVHGTVFKTRWLNHFFAHLLGFLGVINNRFFWYSHTEHHKYTLHPPDDLEVEVPQYHSTGSFFKVGFIQPQFYNIFLGQLRYARKKFIGDWEPELLPEEARERRNRVANWSRFILGGHFLIAVVSIASGNWVIPILTSMPMAYGGWLFFLCNNTQHAGLVENVNDFRLNCRTIYLNPVIRFLYWQMNYHIEHHMYAAVPCYHLKALHQAIRHELPHCPKGLIETWVEIAYIQYRQKEDESYRFVAELPDQKTGLASNQSRLEQIRQQADARLVLEQTNSTGGGRQWECQICGFIYDEAKGLPEEGIEPGTPWDAIPDDWACPDCGVSKAEFDMREIAERMERPIASEDAIVIVGSGLAGYGLAREFRKLNQTQPLLLLTQDDGRAYSKPMLSNALSKQKSVEDLSMGSASDMAEQLGIEVVADCTVSSFDPQGKTVTTSQGNFVYRDLVLATGAVPVRISIGGDCADRVLHVNSLNDFEIFSKALPEGGRVAVLGAGLIGCEFANDLVLAGHTVEVIDLAQWPLERLVPPVVGKQIRDVFAGLGITWHLQQSLRSVEAIEGAPSLRCVLETGHAFEADVVLSAVGLSPKADLAEAAGLVVGRGIAVDEYLRSSDCNVFALGDCAEVCGQVLPYVLPITHSSRALANTLAGNPQSVAYPTMPIVIKTPNIPMIVVLPPKGVEGKWETGELEGGLCARFYDANGSLLGFVLTDEACRLKSEFVEQIESVTPSCPLDV